jgi:hypothetical protein
MCKRADRWPFLLGLQISKSYPNILVSWFSVNWSNLVLEKAMFSSHSVARLRRRSNHRCDCSLTFCSDLHTLLFSSLLRLMEITVSFSEDRSVLPLHLVLWQGIPTSGRERDGAHRGFESKECCTVSMSGRGLWTHDLSLKSIAPEI